MNNLPNFSNFGYQVINILGKNHSGGRIAYLATKINKPDHYVVIKEFKFAQFNSDWLGYKAYEKEINILKQLNHCGIPKYLDSFETDYGFCMVQEYKKAPFLATSHIYSPQQIKDITIAVLEILVYLQNLTPTVIHRDIKPENILVDAQLNVYLVDFGFAHLGRESLAMSSITLGTLGFMPPEQLYNRKLTLATDLYSLGITLICLLTNTKSTAVENLIDDDNNINFKHLLPELSKRWLNWIQILVQPNPKNRYANAFDALKELNQIYIYKQPEVNLNISSLEFNSTTYGEKLTKTITVSISVVETILEGNWQVAPHPSDSVNNSDKHSWIDFSEQCFSRNKAKVEITIDTSQLLAGKSYNREILLHTNSYPEIKAIAVKVNTSKINKIKKELYINTLILIYASGMVSILLIYSVDIFKVIPFYDLTHPIYLSIGIGAIVMVVTFVFILDRICNQNKSPKERIKSNFIVCFLFSIGVGISHGIVDTDFLAISYYYGFTIIEKLIGFVEYISMYISPFLLYISLSNINNLARRHKKQAWQFVIISLLAITTGIGLGYSLVNFDYNKLYENNALKLSFISGLSLLSIFLYNFIYSAIKKLQYSKNKQQLIKP